MMSSFLTSNDYLIISRLLTFFSTSYGSNGRLKLIQNLDNTANICTSMSKRIQHQLKCRHLVSRLLSAALHKQISIYHDGGLHFIIVFCNCLLLFRDLSVDVNKQNRLFESCLRLINEIHIPHETITLNSIHPFVSIVRAVICKPLAYNNSDIVRERLCLLSVKSFLENVSLISTSKQQLILTLEGVPVEHSTLFNGLLYETSRLNRSLLSENSRTCLYFTVSLAGDYLMEDLDHIETDKHMFEWIQNIAERISKQIIQYTCLHHGGLVLCQKVIHPTVKSKLREYGIDTIDRLGRQYTPYFCYLTDCQPIESFTFDTLDERSFGTLAEIKSIDIENKQFLQFLNPCHPFHTLVLCSPIEQTLLELKECITASHHVLTNVLLTKQILYGGGCSESRQILFLKSQSLDLSVRYLLKILGNIIRAQANDHQYMIDRVHGHLWYLVENNEISQTCACELYSKTDRLQSEPTKYFFYLDDDDKQEKSLSNENEELFIRNVCAKYLDSFQMRTDAFKTAVETAINLHLTSICL